MSEESYLFLFVVESVRRTFRKFNFLYNKSHFNLKYCVCYFLLLVNLVRAWVYSSPTQCFQSLMIRVVNTEENGTQRKTGRMQEVKNLERQRKESNYHISFSNSSSFHLNSKKLIVTLYS